MLIAGESSGALRREGETIELVAPINDEIHLLTFDLGLWFPLAMAEFFSLTIVDEYAPATLWSDPAAWRMSARPGGSPGSTDTQVLPPDTIVISEVMTNPSDGFNDWIELHNTSQQAIDIGGWWLADDERGRPRFFSYQIPEPTVIPPGGYVVFNRQDHFGFGLSSFGESVQLTAADSQSTLGYSKIVRFPAAAVDVTFGPHVTSTGLVEMVPLQQPTPGAPNADIRQGPLVITEIMYHPAFTQDPFVEIKNVSTSVISAQVTWNRSSQVQFGEVQPGQTVLLVNIDADQFRTRYAIPPDVGIVQSLTGSLEAGSTIEIQALEGNQWALSDHVTFDDEGPWPADADLGGASLERIGPAFGYGNDPTSWRVTDRLGGTPGLAFVRVPGDANGDGRFDSGDLVLVFQAGEYEDAVAHNSSFEEGDWNGDGDFGTDDLVLAFQTGNYVQAAHVVPSAGQYAMPLIAAVDRIFRDSAAWTDSLGNDGGDELGVAGDAQINLPL
jgi:hypothetical protein